MNDGQRRHVDAGPVVKFGVHVSRAHHVYSDAGAAQPDGQTFGERHHVRLGRRIGRTATGQQPRDAGDVDDCAGAGVDHRRQRGAGQLHHRGDVDVELGLQHRGVGGPEFAGCTETGVVHQHVDTGGQPLGDLVPAGGLGEIGRQHLDVAAALVGQLGGQLGQAISVAGHQHDVVAVGGVATSEAFADPGRGPGDQGDAARHGASVLSGRCGSATQRWWWVA